MGLPSAPVRGRRDERTDPAGARSRSGGRLRAWHQAGTSLLKAPGRHLVPGTTSWGGPARLPVPPGPPPCTAPLAAVPDSQPPFSQPLGPGAGCFLLENATQPWARLVLHVVRVSPPGSQPLGGLPEGGTQGTPGCLASLSAPCVPSTWSIGPLCPPIQAKPQGVKDSGASASAAA